MHKFVGWLLALLLVVAFAAIEWRPWEWLSNSASQAQTAAVGSDVVVGVDDAVRDAAGRVTGEVTDKLAAMVAPAPVIQPPSSVSQTLETIDGQRPAIRAQLTPVRYTTLAAEINAKVQSLPFKEGQAFESGAALVVFDCVIQKAQLARVQAELEIAQRNAQTNDRLLKLGNISRVEAQNALSEASRAQAQVDELSAIVSKCQIAAPYSGKVAEQRARVEQFVQVGQPVLEILDDSGLELEFIAPSRWAPWLKPGHAFTIEIDETGKTYPAVVTRVAARIDSVSQTFKVVAQIDGEFADLTPGMSGTITVSPP
jgi:membrane fusion protein, multidrug efflux system